MPQLRHNIITGEWVVFAPERAKRPNDYVTKATSRKQKKEDCPFCLDSDKSDYKNQLKEFETNLCYIIPNKFPVYIEDDQICAPKVYKIEDDFFRLKNALGGHDVIVVKDHDASLPEFGKEIWVDLFSLIKKRYEHFAKICNVEYVMPIYNHGPEAAASIEHPHAQVLASAIVPNIVARELTHTASYHQDHKSCAFCDLIAHEKEQNTRTLFENDDFVAFCFYAARFPFEIWILPKSHKSRFEKITPSEIENLAEISREVFERLNSVLNDPPLNFFIHSAPVDEEKELDYYHWHLEVAPRLTIYGGYELGSGVIIDIITPESAADYLRITREAQQK